MLKYYFNTGAALQSINTPLSSIQCPPGCDCIQHKLFIDQLYDNIVYSLKTAARDCVPCIPTGALKHFWNDNLDKLKEYSIDMHNLWR